MGTRSDRPIRFQELRSTWRIRLQDIPALPDHTNPAVEKGQQQEAQNGIGTDEFLIQTAVEGSSCAILRPYWWELWLNLTVAIRVRP